MANAMNEHEVKFQLERQKYIQGEIKHSASKLFIGFGWLVLICLISIVLLSSCSIYAKYNVWWSGLSGEAELKKAEWNRQIAVREAQAKFDSSALLAKAEIQRAMGVAQANKIIGDSLKNNEAYLRYLWIDHLQNKHNNVIYVPTEANLPILEANRLSANKMEKNIK